MDLWIRSQDREKLVKINDKIYCEHLEEPLDEYGDVLYCYDISTDADTLGTYSTEKRALEVLDEIQKLLTPQVCELARKIANNEHGDYNKLTNVYAIMDGTGTVNISEITTVIYEMPKE